MACKTEREASEFVDRIANYELVSGIIWVVIAIIQLCTCWLAVAGIWNIVIALSRFNAISQIKSRDASIPEAYESIVMLVLVAVINLIFGGVIGILLVAFDFYVRNQILENKHVFNRRVANDGSGSVGTNATSSAEPLASEDDAMDLLTRLARLRELGALTLDEYSRMKQSLLEQFRKAK